MDDLLLPIETRSRSRSKTPFLRSSCDRESCAHINDEDHEHHHHHKKSPILSKKHKQIATIIEEETEKRPQTPVKKQTFKTSTITKTSSTRTTSDYSSNSSEDLSTNTDITPTPFESTVLQQLVARGQNQNQLKNNENVTKSTVTTTTRVTRNITNGRTPINNLYSNISKEILQNESNTAFEETSKIKTSTPIMGQNIQINKKKSIKVNENNINGDIIDPNHPGYKEYVLAGEYWNKYPKTDYTYSKLSPHRRELAPGVVAFPNMSRKSLEKYNIRVSNMMEKYPDQAESIRKRFIQTLFTRKRQSESTDVSQLLYDSQDETDSSVQHIQQESFIRRFITRIVSIFTVFTSVFTRNKDKNQSLLYRTSIHHNNEGIWTRSKNALKYAVWYLYSRIYLLISSVLYLDAILLRSSNPDGKNKKRFLLFLLMILPFLLLAGLYYYLHPNEPYPHHYMIEYSKNINMPEIDFSRMVDSENIDYLKTEAYQKIDNLRLWTEDYFEYLKTISKNVASETHKIVMENFSN